MKIGDRVKIVNYGQPIFYHKSLLSKYKVTENIIGETDTHLIVDIKPDIVGKEGIITDVNSRGDGYAIHPIGAWYNENQIELL